MTTVAERSTTGSSYETCELRAIVSRVVPEASELVARVATRSVGRRGADFDDSRDRRRVGSAVLLGVIERGLRFAYPTAGTTDRYICVGFPRDVEHVEAV
jgi:hypothetical protein